MIDNERALEIEAAEKLGEAFAVIRRYYGYIPEKLLASRLKDLTCVGDFFPCIEWENNPKAYARVITALLLALDEEDLNETGLVSA